MTCRAAETPRTTRKTSPTFVVCRTSTRSKMPSSFRSVVFTIPEKSWWNLGRGLPCMSQMEVFPVVWSNRKYLPLSTSYRTSVPTWRLFREVILAGAVGEFLASSFSLSPSWPLGLSRAGADLNPGAAWTGALRRGSWTAWVASEVFEASLRADRDGDP